MGESEGEREKGKLRWQRVSSLMRLCVCVCALTCRTLGARGHPCHLLLLSLSPAPPLKTRFCSPHGTPCPSTFLRCRLSARFSTPSTAPLRLLPRPPSPCITPRRVCLCASASGPLRLHCGCELRVSPHFSLDGAPGNRVSACCAVRGREWGVGGVRRWQRVRRHCWKAPKEL